MADATQPVLTSNAEPALTANLPKGLGDTFGNYMLHGIEEVHLPEAVAWWPQTLGWKILLGLLVLWCCKRIYRSVQRWQRNHYRRVALKQLAQLAAADTRSPQTLRQLPVLLKATALKAYPRTEVANLSGHRWLALLDSKWNETCFASKLGECLLMISYQHQDQWHFEDGQVEQLFATLRRWIKHHQSAEPVSAHV